MTTVELPFTVEAPGTFQRTCEGRVLPTKPHQVSRFCGKPAKWLIHGGPLRIDSLWRGVPLCHECYMEFWPTQTQPNEDQNCKGAGK